METTQYLPIQFTHCRNHHDITCKNPNIGANFEWEKTHFFPANPTNKEVCENIATLIRIV